MSDYNLKPRKTQSFIAKHLNLQPYQESLTPFDITLNSCSFQPPSSVGPMFPVERSLLDVNQKEVMAALKGMVAKALRTMDNESAEYLGVDLYYRETLLFTANDYGKKLRGRPFMNACIIQVTGYVSNDGEVGAIIKLQVTGMNKIREVVIEPALWGSTKLVDKIQCFGVQIIAKISKERKRDLLAGYIRSLMDEESMINPKEVVQWYKEGDKLLYADGRNCTLVDSGDIKTKKLCGFGDERDFNGKLELLVRALTIFKEPEYGALVFMSCVGGFMKSILLRSSWKPETMLCFCGSKIEIMSVIECFVSFWDSVPPRIITALQSEKKFKEAVINTGDELIIVDCGHEVVSAPYQESQRKANIQFAANWAERSCRCFPVAISNDLFDVCSIGDIVIPIVIEKANIQWDVWQGFSNRKDAVSALIYLLRRYIESAGESVQQRIAEVIAEEYAKAQETSNYPGLKAVYRAINDTLVRMIEYWNLGHQWSELLMLACEKAVELLELYSNDPAEEFISGQFVCCMEALADRGEFAFFETTANFADESLGANVYYDECFLYMEMVVFKNVVLKEMCISNKNASKVLGILKKSEHVCPYQRGKDFCVDVIIGRCTKRRSMLRFVREKFGKLGQVDIVMKGRAI